MTSARRSRRSGVTVLTQCRSPVDFRGALETDDGATILYGRPGYARAAGEGMRELIGGITHITDDPRYAWLDNAYYALVGEVRPRSSGSGFDVLLDVSAIVREPSA